MSGVDCILGCYILFYLETEYGLLFPYNHLPLAAIR